MCKECSTTTPGCLMCEASTGKCITCSPGLEMNDFQCAPTAGLGAGPIAGIVLGAIVLVAVAIGGIVFYLRHNNSSHGEDADYSPKNGVMMDNLNDSCSNQVYGQDKNENEIKDAAAMGILTRGESTFTVKDYNEFEDEVEDELVETLNKGP